MKSILASPPSEGGAPARSGVRERRSHEERSAETQAALVEAAISTLRDRGYAGITTAEVARRAGCTTGAMHHHFGSKAELMLAVLTRMSVEFEQAYRDLPTFAARSLKQRCDGVVDALAPYYGSPRYLAVWELHVGTRCEPDLNRICVENRARVMAAFETVWLGLFADVSATHAERVALMQFALTYLRCLGIERSLGVTSDASTVHLDVLKAVLLERLGSYGLKDGSPARSTRTRTRKARP